MARRNQRRSSVRPKTDRRGVRRVYDTTRRVIRAIDMGKQSIEPGIDKIIAVAAANTGAVYAASEIIDRSDLSNPSNAFIMMTTGAALTIGNVVALRDKENNRFRKGTARVNSALDSVRPVSWAKTAALATVLGISAYHLSPYVHQMINDVIPVTDTLSGTPSIPRQAEPPVRGPVKDTEPKTAWPAKPQAKKKLENIVSRSRPAIYNHLGHETKVDHDFSYARLANPYSTTGRIQRALRWQPIYRAVEKAYGLPEDLLAGMIMQESMGDPVMPNAGGDGGLGIVHFQCTTANEWGLNTYGACNGLVDHAHGKAVKKLIVKKGYDPAKLEAHDDRAHLIKVLDAAARLVKHYSKVHGSLDHGIEAYGPGKVGKNRAWRYMVSVKNHRASIRDPEKLKQAADDFKRRTGKNFSTYIRHFHETADNWGLDKYIAALIR